MIKRCPYALVYLLCYSNLAISEVFVDCRIGNSLEILDYSKR